jgi:hypothetical protein
MKPRLLQSATNASIASALDLPLLPDPCFLLFIPVISALYIKKAEVESPAWKTRPVSGSPQGKEKPSETTGDGFGAEKTFTRA